MIKADVMTVPMQGDDHFKPSAFESEIHPSHKSSICTLGISPLQGAKVSRASLTNADAFVLVRIRTSVRKRTPYGVHSHEGGKSLL